jgi:quercetin dioxygenase-like cupin family protein
MATKNEGAVQAGGGQYAFKLTDLNKIDAGAGYSTSNGSVVEGERMQIGLIDKARGTGSRPHSHPNEQFNYVLKGTLKVNIDGQEFLAPAGTVVYVPPNMVHSMVATPEEDVIFYVVKDLSHGIAGKAADGKETGAHYEAGFEPRG